MREFKSPYGTVRIGERKKLFERVVDIMETAAASAGEVLTVGWTGGSTPRAFHQWAAAEEAFSQALLRTAVWSVSDERYVPIGHADSNFGNLDRELLQPLGVASARKLPWPVQVDPHSAASVFTQRLQERFGAGPAFDLCFLGMGDDGHTASIFPESPLLLIEGADPFAPVQVPGKGWRLSITPAGLQQCGKVVVLVTGAAKAERLQAVLQGDYAQYPIQILSTCAARTEWLVDDAAAALLEG